LTEQNENDEAAAIESSVPRVHAQPRIAPRVVKTANEEISPTERQKLRALMRELNTARASN
jgi:hypothetical protein